ncbi:MAG TPA: LuxR C-terminal-related transcriptional regulator [Tepidisphaeraceae bacterium]|jgi:DNA-binding CsgD family transcriptional regulator|nr:LuxR C-terminal-related transcriptional regulator [Tepidisphaeraceae bacterium]
MPERLKLRDVRAIFRLVGELRELGADPNAWRPHMVQRLLRIVHAQVVVSSEVHFRNNPSRGTMQVVDVGWACNEDGKTWQIQVERDDEQPENYWLASGQKQEDSQERVPVKPARKVYGGRCFLLSQFHLPHVSAVDQLGLHRAWGDEPFSKCEHKLVRVLHVELGRLWKRDVLNDAKNPATDLPPRLSQTLAALLEGCSEKQIAIKLELSRHTIHNYVKALHQRLGVSSRGELLALANSSKQDFIPRLSMPK